ncbi:hypothetical protein JCM16418A_08260 [Paenibacillus pini]|uniref:Uncharacterized protein n=1 Tax=Paenibacillus pini JCM 16418 TaxID=1236976 RepID=W7Y6S5_9BACL|nr:hypothetical protein JCM16418_585 [Paenibacillus pini JCM 16418]
MNVDIKKQLEAMNKRLIVLNHTNHKTRNRFTLLAIIMIIIFLTYFAVGIIGMNFSKLPEFF